MASPPAIRRRATGALRAAAHPARQVPDDARRPNAAIARIASNRDSVSEQRAGRGEARVSAASVAGGAAVQGRWVDADRPRRVPAGRRLRTPSAIDAPCPLQFKDVGYL